MTTAYWIVKYEEMGIVRQVSGQITHATITTVASLAADAIEKQRQILCGQGLNMLSAQINFIVK